MAITINGKTYRNLQEQVKKNMDDIEELQGEIIDPENFVSIDTDQTITGEKTFDSNITIINSHDIDAASSTAYFGSIYENGHDISDVYATKDDVYTKAEADLTFADVDDVYTKSEIDEMNSDMEDYVDDKIDNVNAIIGDGYLSQLTATFGTSGNYKSVLNLGNLVEYSDYEDNGTNNTQFKANRSLYISVEKGSIITLVGYPDYSSYQIITDETTYDNLTGTTTLTALSTQVIEIKSLSSSNYYISLNVTNYIKETLTDAINDLGTKAIQKNADGNITEKLYLVNGISSADGEETDNKATISLDSGVRRSILALNAGGEDGYANIELRGGTSGDGFVTITGDVTVDSIYRPKVGTGANQEQVAYLSDIPASVSGVNNGTNWTSITIGNDTYGIPTGGSGSIVAGTGIDITNGVVSATQAKPYCIKCEDYVISPSIVSPSIMFHIWLEAATMPTTAPSWSSICSSLPADRPVQATGQWYDGSDYYEIEGVYKLISSASTVTIFGHKRITSSNISSTSATVTISTTSTDVNTSLGY